MSDKMKTSLGLAILASLAPIRVYSWFEALPAFNIDKDHITVSGFSSGASFATQVSLIKRFLLKLTQTEFQKVPLYSFMWRSVPW